MACDATALESGIALGEICAAMPKGGGVDEQFALPIDVATITNVAPTSLDVNFFSSHDGPPSRGRLYGQRRSSHRVIVQLPGDGQVHVDGGALQDVL